MFKKKKHFPMNLLTACVSKALTKFSYYIADTVQIIRLKKYISMK